MEGEALLLGIWKNVEDLEMHLTIEELELILEAAREREYRQNKFMAALKGIDLDAQSQEDVQDRFEKIKMRAEAKLTGRSAEHLEFDAMGIDVETD